MDWRLMFVIEIFPHIDLYNGLFHKPNENRMSKLRPWEGDVPPNPIEAHTFWHFISYGYVFRCLGSLPLFLHDKKAIDPHFNTIHKACGHHISSQI